LAQQVLEAISTWDHSILVREHDHGDRLDLPAISAPWAEFRYDVDLAAVRLEGLTQEDRALEIALRMLGDALGQAARMLECSG